MESLYEKLTRYGWRDVQAGAFMGIQYDLVINHSTALIMKARILIKKVPVFDDGTAW
jgi:hypothetical protein